MRVFIEVGDLVTWRGSFTGIQRANYEVAKNFVNMPDFEVYYFSYSRLNNIFIGVSQKEIYQKDAVQHIVFNAKNQSDTRSRVVNVIKSRIPRRFKVFILDRMKIKYLMGGLLRLVRRASRHKDNTNAITPYDEDVILLPSLYLNSTYGGMLEYIRSKDLRCIQLVYDAIPIVTGYSDRGLSDELSEFYKLALANCELVCISQNTKKDVLTLAEKMKLTIPEPKVIRLGEDIDKSLMAIKPDCRGSHIDSDFLLTVGTVEIRKNHAILFYAYRLAHERGIDLPPLVICGRRGWLSESTQKLIDNDPVISKKLIILDNCDDSRLKWLYQNCKFTVWPSFYEGWGLPIAESLNYGKLCISSNTSSMPEVGGDLVEYFSPYDVDELLELLMEYSTNTKLLAKKEKKIHDTFKTTTWKDCAEQIAEIVGAKS
jgi:glycosyltransferase involved in cell wall biosynthesis